MLHQTPAQVEVLCAEENNLNVSLVFEIAAPFCLFVFLNNQDLKLGSLAIMGKYCVAYGTSLAIITYHVL